MTLWEHFECHTLHDLGGFLTQKMQEYDAKVRKRFNQRRQYLDIKASTLLLIK